MDINFELYKVFYYVAKHLSFSAAANELFISQSAVSQSIKLLEEKLNSKLFVRSTKQVHLSPAGVLLFTHVEQAFQFLKLGERNINELHSLEQGELRVGASDTICKYYLLPYFKQFNQLYPKIKINVTNRPSPVCVELLKKGLIDISVVNLAHDQSYQNMTISKRKVLHDVFIASSDFDYLKNQRLSLEDLACLPLLTLEKNTTTRRYLDTLFASHNISFNPEIQLGSIDLLIELVKIGLGISFVSREYVQKELTDNQLFTLTLTTEITPRELGIMTHDCLPVPLAAQKFIELL
ncbi:MAG: LysR family transcriptional regulator [Sporomusaceae bacterium]|nr:LysR family transcriptional regulator [Sporomusaceae bacterium]